MNLFPNFISKHLFEHGDFNAVILVLAGGHHKLLNEIYQDRISIDAITGDKILVMVFYDIESLSHRSDRFSELRMIEEDVFKDSMTRESYQLKHILEDDMENPNFTLPAILIYDRLSHSGPLIIEVPDNIKFIELLEDACNKYYRQYKKYDKMKKEINEIERDIWDIRTKISANEKLKERILKESEELDQHIETLHRIKKLVNSKEIISRHFFKPFNAHKDFPLTLKRYNIISENYNDIFEGILVPTFLKYLPELPEYQKGTPKDLERIYSELIEEIKEVIRNNFKSIKKMKIELEKQSTEIEGTSNLEPEKARLKKTLKVLERKNTYHPFIIERNAIPFERTGVTRPARKRDFSKIKYFKVNIDSKDS